MTKQYIKPRIKVRSLEDNLMSTLSATNVDGLGIGEYDKSKPINARDFYFDEDGEEWE